MFMAFHSRPGHRPWLIAGFFLLLVVGVILLTSG